MNRSSGKVIDLPYFTTENGANTQQWDYFGGINQLWEMIPVQNEHVTTAQTDIFYEPWNNRIYAEASEITDYQTLYYYSAWLVAQLYEDDQFVASVASPRLADNPAGGPQAFAYAGVHYPTTPGKNYTFKVYHYVEEYYTVSQVTTACGVFCSSYYDPYHYGQILATGGQGGDLPTFSTTVYAPLISVMTYFFSQSIPLGEDADEFSAPGYPSSYRETINAFIPVSYVPNPTTGCTPPGRPFDYYLMAGDNRSFSPWSNRFRLHQSAVILAPSGDVRTPEGRQGVTSAFAKDALAPDGHTLYSDSILDDCHYLDKETVGTPLINSIAKTVGGPPSVNTHFLASGADPLAFFSDFGPIEWNLTIRVNSPTNPAIVSGVIEGTHKCYPAYEAYVGKQLIYGRKPPSNDQNYLAFCLLGLSNQIQVNQPFAVFR